MHWLIFQLMLHLTNSLAINPPATSSSYCNKSFRFFDFSESDMNVITSFLNSNFNSDKISAPSSESIISRYFAISSAE